MNSDSTSTNLNNFWAKASYNLDAIDSVLFQSRIDPAIHVFFNPLSDSAYPSLRFPRGKGGGVYEIPPLFS